MRFVITSYSIHYTKLYEASLSPDDATVHHTLACILGALGKGNEALESAQRYIRATSVVENTIEDAIELFVELAASGQAENALGILSYNFV